MILPLPPSINSYYAQYMGRRILSKKGRDFKKTVYECCISKNERRFGDARIKLIVIINPADRRKMDISNRIKSLEDALVYAGVIDDDSQVDQIYISRGEIIKGGRCEVSIVQI